jgi:tetratricopeptide (TPR) repeat protein
MRPTLHVTTVLLVAAVATGACSKRGDPSPEKTGARGAAQANPVATSGDSLAVKQIGEEGFAPEATATIAAPASFADGEAAFQAKKYGDATAIFERYVVQRPKNPWGHYMLGLSAWKSGDLTKSEQAFETALSLDPYHVKSLVNVSRLFIDQKRHDDAVGTLTSAADIDPESVEVQRLLGRTYHAQGKTDDAVAAYRRAIELNELDAWSMNNLGLLLLEAQRAEEALPLFAGAVELRQDVPIFHNNLGMALEHTGRFKAAAAAYSGALAADPGYKKAEQNRARVEAVKGGPEEPFELEKTVRGDVEGTLVAGDEQAASK